MTDQEAETMRELHNMTNRRPRHRIAFCQNRPYGHSRLDIVRVDTEIARRTPGATTDSLFIKSQLPAISSALEAAIYPSCPHLSHRAVRVLNGDTFAITRQIIHENPKANGNIAVLNLASGESPAGRWNGTRTSSQEEALCFSSTLYTTLKPEYYPWPNRGKESIVGIYSPAVAITRHGPNQPILPVNQRQIISTISVAAQKSPDLNQTCGPAHLRSFKHANDLHVLREKIRLIYRMAAKNGKTFLVLGAFGCGAYRCPPVTVAREMKTILREKEFTGWFEEVVFAIFGQEPKPGGRPDTGFENYRIFKQVFEGGP